MDFFFFKQKYKIQNAKNLTIDFDTTEMYAEYENVLVVFASKMMQIKERTTSRTETSAANADKST